MIAARPSMGKTSLALTLAQHAAIEHKAVVGIFSLEMSAEALAMRMLCSEASVDAQKFRSGYLSNEEWSRLGKALGKLADARIFIDDTPAISVLEMRAKSRRLATEQKQLDMIVVDYMQLMSGSTRRFESRQQEVSQISRELKALAKELNVILAGILAGLVGLLMPSFVIVDRQALPESGAVANLRTINTVEATYASSHAGTYGNIAELIVAKQRNGPTDTVYLAFLNQFARFADLDRDALGAYLSRFDRSKGSARINRGGDEF